KRRREAVEAASHVPTAEGDTTGEGDRHHFPKGREMEPVPMTIKKLARAANDFVVYRKSPDGTDGSTVIAGYPWFSDWGRDTMIALPGLFLVPRRFEQAKQVLTVFAKYVSEGMIPNRLNDYANEPEYNAADA